ncbi:MAG: nitrophenyl compound nitroreductase subunit ArsF family protein [Marinilabiliales bacterium]|nr:nitrophenyl compound nitroreductase subunit ArsF family protein [Marinilabiliales bacterium]
MKKIIWISIIVVSLAAFLAFRPDGKANVNSDAAVSSADKVEVYYFHFSRRCVTCIAVENKTQEAIVALYPEAYSKGKITFASVNLEDEKSKPIAEKAKVTGQALMIMSGDFRKDLTSEGFMNANNNFEKFKAEIQKTVDPLVKELK